MKTIRYFFFAAMATLLMAADCSNSDSEFYNDVFVNVSEIVEIETQQTYVVGDLLWINTNDFSRYLSETDQMIQLDVYKSCGGAPAFNFTYLLERRASGQNWEIVNLQGNLESQRGSAEAAEFVFARSTYNIELEEYQYRNGIRLTLPGEYRLSFGYNSASLNSVELRSESVNNNLFVNIKSSNPDIDSNGFYTFTVN